ncbi:hypothetical protein CIL05_02255 [Virgibacillus profundi]|uniref:Uncharacterized protein n=1 Tax=Virgibacillus profundi TaxID=2024555 RepID=A0A2A2II72_9BACI|nr:hypothetical protein [Virgibacillus profundi]PAV31499.1 hypothetical protein CIL05_02255 [Virgibacillus profundi]PXY55685.1 hypothetical protein CIT14_02265 [Virgibacillus profundi]
MFSACVIPLKRPFAVTRLTFDGTVYTNAKDIEWVNEEELTLGEKVGEIQNQTDNSKEFENFTASKLPTGTEIYELEEKKGPIFIVKLDGDKIPYLGLVA